MEPKDKLSSAPEDQRRVLISKTQHHRVLTRCGICTPLPQSWPDFDSFVSHIPEAGVEYSFTLGLERGCHHVGFPSNSSIFRCAVCSKQSCSEASSNAPCLLKSRTFPSQTFLPIVPSSLSQRLRRRLRRSLKIIRHVEEVPRSVNTLNVLYIYR